MGQIGEYSAPLITALNIWYMILGQGNRGGLHLNFLYLISALWNSGMITACENAQTEIVLTESIMFDDSIVIYSVLHTCSLLTVVNIDTCILDHGTLYLLAHYMTLQFGWDILVEYHVGAY
ncbi:hypothetical protein ACJX0J_034376 [Zea mays]